MRLRHVNVVDPTIINNNIVTQYFSAMMRTMREDQPVKGCVPWGGERDNMYGGDSSVVSTAIGQLGMREDEGTQGVALQL